MEVRYKSAPSHLGRTVEHPRTVKTTSRLQEGCPVVLEEDALPLIQEIEDRRKHDDALLPEGH